MLKGIRSPLPLEQFTVIPPFTGTFKTKSFVGSRRKIIVAVSPDFKEAISFGLAKLIHDALGGRFTEILPVSPLPAFAICS